ncbi:MAG: integration host factor subunit beta [bacterium]|nr:integration host factor subunit beta [bacterium]
MDKKKLVKIIASETPTYKDAYRIVTRIFEEIKNAVRNGERVSIHSFGSFVPVIAKARKARNPKTGSIVIIPDKRKVRFKQSKLFFM